MKYYYEHLGISSFSYACKVYNHFDAKHQTLNQHNKLNYGTTTNGHDAEYNYYVT